MLNSKLPLLSAKELLQETNKMPHGENHAPDDGVVVLVLKRSSVTFLDENDKEKGGFFDIDQISIKPNPEIIALASMENDGTIRQSHKTWYHFSDRIKQKTCLALITIIGSAVGIHPFKRIWALTTPLSWRSEEDIEV
jgi:hypothetical protein